MVPRTIADCADIPAVQEGMNAYFKWGLLFAPSKAASGGWSAVPELELTQNSRRMSRSRNELYRRLHKIMKDIHD